MRRMGTPGAGISLPRWVYVPAVLGALFVVLPLVAMAVKVDWAHFWPLITSTPSQAALLLSLRTAVASTALCVLLGVPMALVLARSNGGFVRAVRPLILLPLVLPPVVGGIALLYAFGRLGLLGQYLETAGIRIAFTTTAVVLAQTFVSLPFLVIALEGRRPHGRSRLRPGGRDAGGPSGDRVVAGDAAAAGARPGLRCGAGVRPFAGRVRRHADLRRVPAGRHPDAARWRSTCSARATRTRRWRCRFCWSRWPRSSCSVWASRRVSGWSAA